MKFVITSSIVLMANLGATSAGAPKYTIELQDGSFDGVQDGLDPIFSIEGSIPCEDRRDSLNYGLSCDLSGGSLASFPRSFWGEYFRKAGRWGLRGRVATDAFEAADIEVSAENNDSNLDLTFLSSAGKDTGTTVLDVSKTFDASYGSFTINPSWDFDEETHGLRLECEKGGSSLEWFSSSNESALTLSKSIGVSSRISPSVTDKGEFSLEVDFSEGEDSSILAHISNDCLDVEWSENEWIASFNIPLKGNRISGTNISIKRDISF